jgi:hypothetical protein
VYWQTCKLHGNASSRPKLEVLRHGGGHDDGAAIS